MKLALDGFKEKNDVIIESQGIKVVYHPDLEAYLKNAVVNYENKWYKRGFVLDGLQLFP